MTSAELQMDLFAARADRGVVTTQEPNDRHQTSTDIMVRMATADLPTLVIDGIRGTETVVD